MLTNRPSRLNRTYALKGLIFLLPALLIYFYFAVLPVLDSVVLSFQNWNGNPRIDRIFTGFTNYAKAFKDKTFQIAIKNSVYIGFVSSFISVIVGVLLAWLLLYVPKKAGGFYRTILFSPAMIPAREARLPGMVCFTVSEAG